ncbi:SCO family protein [Anaerobacillus alkaliphilus]|uniref:SCO family protein n=1 Tax=Anaerobacillus alkaliphilus TaxID=1548597 RepID=UPI0013754949|nr:SCO family protein [Anaerobacillus alkaliphilus]
MYHFQKKDTLPVLDQVEPFILEDRYGNLYTSNNEKVKLLAFFYTRCPDICPMTMMDFRELQAKLKLQGVFGKDVELIAITLDPEHDDLQAITIYAEAFEADPEGWKFLRGTLSETEKVANAYHMKFKKVSGDFIAHNTTMFLIDKDNRIRGLYDMANAKKRIDQDGIMDALITLVNE